MAQSSCETCGQKKTDGGTRTVYYCKKCNRTGCWAAGPLGGLIEKGSCLPRMCEKGGEHDKIMKYVVQK
jgi:hypothetical protein